MVTEDGDQEFEIRRDERDEGVSTPGSVSDTMRRFEQRMRPLLDAQRFVSDAFGETLLF